MITLELANFLVPSNSVTRGVGVSDRIVLEGENWDIVGKSPAGFDEVEFTAKRSL